MKKRRVLASVLAFSMLFGNGGAAYADPASGDAVSDDAVTKKEETASYDEVTEIGYNLNAGEAYEGSIGLENKVDLESDTVTYADMLNVYEEKGYKDVSEDTEILLSIDDVQSDAIVPDEEKLDDDQKMVVGYKDGKEVTQDVKGIKFYKNMEVDGSDEKVSCTYVEWKFQVEEAGLYEMYVNVKPESSYGTLIQRRFIIDGEVPFEELHNVYFSRRFEEQDKVETNAIGNEVWPSHREVCAWQKQPVVDNSGYYEDPLKIYFGAGEHTLRIEYVDQNITIGDVLLKGATKYQSYEEYHKKTGDKSKDVEAIRIQAEEAIYKSESTIRRENDTDPKTQSLDRKKQYAEEGKKASELDQAKISNENSATEQLLNIIGGSRWSSGNQSITWEVNVEKDGLYTINARGKQEDNVGMPAYRQIAIDGEIPFEEMKLYPFEYNADGWTNYTIGEHDEKGNLVKDGEYQFYLTKGTHKITMTVKSGAMYEIENLTNKAISMISEKYIEITKVTGTSPDANYNYHLARDMAYLKDDFKDIADLLQQCSDLLSDISYEKSDMETNYDTIIATMREFSKDPDLIVTNLSELEDAQTNLGDYLLNLGDMPLTFDYIELLPVGSKFEVETSSFWTKLWYNILNFFASFVKEYDAVGSISAKDGAKETLDVWIARGREWGEILKSLADEKFSKETGIEINLNILPSGQLNAGNVNVLMLAITSGKAPDVGMGVAYSEPVEFAFREATVDLTQFDDYDEYIEANFPNDTMMVPYKYKQGDHEGVYAIPETMDFNCVIYRTDIFEALGVKVPATWDELWTVTLPELDKNNMSFSFPVDSTASANSPSALKAMTMFLIQNGGTYYCDSTEKKAKENATMNDATQGLYTNLDTEAGIKSFQQWCDMYTNYGLDAESSFFTRFRTGTLPIGTCTYASYMQILTQAPELYGRWKISPMIGSYTEDGDIDNRVSGISLTACQIMSQSEKQESSWEFLKWWMDAETQTSYGQDIEATMGVTARWNTANLQAFQQLPWDAEDIAVISESIETAVEQPIVLGGYFTTRHLYNAWSRVYMNNENPRDAIEEAVKDINKELRNKHEEYGFTYEE